jgi:hypothetical protein
MDDAIRKRIAQLREYDGRAANDGDIALAAQALADDAEFCLLVDEIAKSLGCSLSLLARVLISVEEVRKRRMA